MHIDKKTLNLVIPLDRDDGLKVYVHATPVDRAVFDRYFMLIANAYASITGGPLKGYANRVAMRALRQTAEETDMAPDVTAGLIEEIKRLTNVTAPTKDGWQTLPLTQAVAASLIDAEEADEVENNVAFFTCFWHMTRRAERKRVLDGLARAWGVQLSPLDCTEHAASLQTSTAIEPSGPRAPASSIPL